jgi:hypothetical protein
MFVRLIRCACLMLALGIVGCRGGARRNDSPQINRNDSANLTYNDTSEHEVEKEDIYTLCAECPDTLGIVLTGIQDSFLFIKKKSKQNVHLHCYRYVGQAWKSIGDYTVDDGDRWETGDLNFDGKDEMLLSTYTNMNGNTWKEVFVYDSTNDRMVRAGQINDRIHLNSLKKTVEISYSGSYYMEYYVEEYAWVGLKLHSLRKLELERELHADKPRRYFYNICQSSTSCKTKTIWQGTSGISKDDDKFDSLEKHFFDN